MLISLRRMYALCSIYTKYTRLLIVETDSNKDFGN